MLLKDLLKRESNNLDLARLIAACMVIYGHANAFLPSDRRSGGDLVAQFLEFDYSGSLAVKIFFFLSGLVVTNSLLDKKSILQFALARFFRIWPALMAVLIGCAFFIGPLTTSLPLRDYFVHPGTWFYVVDGALMKIDFRLPGVFVGWQSEVINGSLWTIPYEVNAYLFLAALFCFGLHHCRWLAVLVALWIIVDPLMTERHLFSWRMPHAEVDSLAPCFAVGALMALFKDQIQVSVLPVLGCLILFFGFRGTSYAPYILYVGLFFGILYAFSRPVMLRWRPQVDISYGVYLWSWPIQSLLAHQYPQMDVQFHRIAAIIIACCMGWLSWTFLEKHCIVYGRMSYDYLRLKYRIA